MKKAVLALIIAALSCPARADDSLLCLRETARQEQKKQIQTNLLSAIALVESGRYSKTYPTGISWPWTVSADGKGAFYKTKADAVQAVKELQQNGADNIDVGCMQISLKFHPDAFKSVEDAFDPAQNVAYAADFLKRNHADTKSWGLAATRYHSRTVNKAYKYEDKLLDKWKLLTEHGNPAKPAQKAVVHDVSKQKVRAMNRSAKIAERKAKAAEKDKKIKAGSDEAKRHAAAWRKAKLEAYMAAKRAAVSDEPIFEDVRTKPAL